MRGWLRAMFGRTCEQCGGRKPRGTHFCDACWVWVARAWGLEDDRP